MHGNSNLTPEVQKAICDGIRNGMPIEHVMDYVGLTDHTFYRWMRQGKSDHTEDSVYIRFRKAVKKARAANIRRHIKNIRKHSESTWQASAWFLERRDPKNFGRKEVEELVTLKKEMEELKALLAARSGVQ
jgi:hypothetical protein